MWVVQPHHIAVLLKTTWSPCLFLTFTRNKDWLRNGKSWFHSSNRRTSCLWGLLRRWDIVLISTWNTDINIMPPSPPLRLSSSGLYPFMVTEGPRGLRTQCVILLVPVGQGRQPWVPFGSPPPTHIQMVFECSHNQTCLPEKSATASGDLQSHLIVILVCKW